jgi:TRAP-type transport system periplasmic protein
MMRKTPLLLATTLLALPIFCTVSNAQTFNIKVANYFPAPSKQSKLTQEFADELEKRSGGRIKTQHFAGGSLLSGPAMFKGVEGGITDIGYSHVYYTPGRMPVSEGIGLPIGMPSAWVAAHVGYDFYQKFQPKEFSSVRVLAIHGNAPSVLISKKPVRRMEDLKGLTIRAPGMPGEIVKALGATPAPTPMTEVYDAISKGVNDGVWAPYETLRTFRFAEVAKNVTVCWQTGAAFPFFLAMNNNSYNRLPKDLQTLVDTMAQEFQERFAVMWNEIEMEGRDFANEKGVQYIELSEQEGERWKKAMDPVIEGYVKDMAGKGFSEAEVRSWISYMRERIQFWTDKQVQAKISSPTGPAKMRPEAMGK